MPKKHRQQPNHEQPKGITKSSSFDDDVKLSKKMSNVLRHRIHENKLGAHLRPDGYVPLDALLATPGFKGLGIDAARVRAIVRDNDKQRFSIMMAEDGVEYIRANQGHTSSGIDESQLLTPLDEAALVELGGRAVHGTNRKAWDGIVASGGLSPMARHHVHLAAGLPGASGVISGMRASAEVHVWVDLLGAAKAGIPLFRSANGVILTPGTSGTRLLPVEHFARVVDPSRGLEWRDGGWHKAADADAAARPDGGTAGS